MSTFQWMFVAACCAGLILGYVISARMLFRQMGGVPGAKGGKMETIIAMCAIPPAMVVSALVVIPLLIGLPMDSLLMTVPVGVLIGLYVQRWLMSQIPASHLAANQQQ